MSMAFHVHISRDVTDESYSLVIVIVSVIVSMSSAACGLIAFWSERAGQAGSSDTLY